MRVSIRVAIIVFTVVTFFALPAAVLNAESYASPRWADVGCGLQPMEISELGKSFIREHEGISLKPRFDSNGYAIGYGMHTWQGKKVQKNWPRQVSYEQVEAEFDRQLDTFTVIVRESVCAPLTQPMLDGLVSLAWNVGRVNNAIIRKINANRPVRVTDFLTTTWSRGRQVPFLVERRHREYLMFAGNYDTAFTRPMTLVALQSMTRHESVRVGTN